VSALTWPGTLAIEPVRPRADALAPVNVTPRPTQEAECDGEPAAQSAAGWVQLPETAEKLVLAVALSATT